jgi:hypothetical protein
LSNRQIDRRLANGTFTAARRGLLHLPADDSAGGQESTLTMPLALPLDVQAALLASPSRELIVSHASAARLWGLPRPLDGWPQPEFTATSGSNRRRRGIRVKVCALCDGDVVEQNAVLLTSADRTVADCLRTLPGRDALAVADAALHRGLATEAGVLENLHRQSGWPGVGVARQVFKLADFRRESPLESWSAWAFAHTGVPRPEWQVTVRGLDGQPIGRADCWWLRGAIVGEADGRAKYAMAAAERGGHPEALLDVLQAERRREQRLREIGVDVIRWAAVDVLKEPLAHRLAQRILAAIMLGEQRAGFEGVVTPVLRPVATEFGRGHEENGSYRA